MQLKTLHVERVSNAIQHQKPNSEEQNKTSVLAKKLFGRQNTFHKIFGGGQCISIIHVLRVVIPEGIFVNIATSLGAQINQFLVYVQDVACERNLRQFLVMKLWLKFIENYVIIQLSDRCMQDLYVLTLPIVYEKYEDETSCIASLDKSRTTTAN
ncbi:hypothetical protein ZIOFF_052059 [Zingiber officinale]|uniref:Reticulon domain-containing protein n=1 Tax=Zingiber officinale TaxID=94328 RepID=A0A8J5G3B1_ZINOF|nr:hypothetical protein ZIOFF_052059 [Zingiber officinale]